MIKTDSLLMLSTEEYSDQCHSGPFKVLKDFDIHAIAQVVKDTPIVHRWKEKNGPDDVIEYLKKEGFIELLECADIHLGCYGNIEVS